MQVHDRRLLCQPQKHVKRRLGLQHTGRKHVKDEGQKQFCPSWMPQSVRGRMRRHDSVAQRLTCEYKSLFAFALHSIFNISMWLCRRKMRTRHLAS